MYCRRDCIRFRYWQRLHAWWQGHGMGYCGVLLGNRGTAGGAAGMLGWGRRCWNAAGRRRRILLGKELLECCCECCCCFFTGSFARPWILLGPQSGFLLIPCCFDWSDDGLGKPDVVALGVVRDVRPPLRGPRLEDQLPVASIRRVSTLAAPPWICRFEFLKLADGAFAARFVDDSLHPARAAVPEACFCVPCAVDAAPPAVILVLQNVAAPLARHQGRFQVDE